MLIFFSNNSEKKIQNLVPILEKNDVCLRCNMWKSNMEQYKYSQKESFCLMTQVI